LTDEPKSAAPHYIWRGFVTLIAAGGYWLLTNAYTPVATIVSADAARHQFEAVDTGYLTSAYANSLLSGVNGLLSLAFALILLAVWWTPVKRGAAAAISALTAVTLLVVVCPQSASAFAEKADRTEAYTILPNESAFWIPDVGDNKSKETQLDSADYLNANKVALKRFIVPHQKLTGSGGTSILSGWDYYVPSGRLIIVDRTTYSREWVNATDRGTSNRKDGIHCQSSEGLDIMVGVSIGASVSEANAATFLYNFGVKPPVGSRDDINVIFSSVYYSRSLQEVMDDIGRKKVQTLVCAEISSRTLENNNKDANAIMVNVEKQTREYFKSVGITLVFIGWGDTFSFHETAQESINRRYIAQQDEIIAKALQPYAPTIQALAAAQALRNFGEKTDGKLPTTIVGLPTGVGGMLDTLLKASPQPAAPR
jgi:hypothetical protein